MHESHIKGLMHIADVDMFGAEVMVLWDEASGFSQPNNLK